MKVRRSLLLVIVCALLLAPITRAEIPAGENWTVPDNPRWHYVRAEMQRQYVALTLYLTIFTAERDPQVHDYFSVRLWAVSWAYSVYFGVAIHAPY